MKEIQNWSYSMNFHYHNQLWNISEEVITKPYFILTSLFSTISIVNRLKHHDFSIKAKGLKLSIPNHKIQPQKYSEYTLINNGTSNSSGLGDLNKETTSRFNHICIDEYENIVIVHVHAHIQMFTERTITKFKLFNVQKI